MPVAISLPDMPPEIQLQIAEFAQSKQAMNALSITCRRLCRIAQSVLFKTLFIHLSMESRGLFSGLLANPRLCASVRLLRLVSKYWVNGLAHRYGEGTLSLCKNLLPRLVGLRTLHMYDVDLMAGLLETFLEIAANISLTVYLGGIGRTDTAALLPARTVSLRISRFSICIYNTDLDYSPFLFLLRASATALTVLDLSLYRDELMRFEGIVLPSLRKLFLHLQTPFCYPSKKGAGFIAAQRGITWLFLDGDIDIHPFPPDALPNLRTLCAPTRFIKTLISGRPVGVIYAQRDGQVNEPGWPKEEIAQSRASILPTPRPAVDGLENVNGVPGPFLFFGSKA